MEGDLDTVLFAGISPAALPALLSQVGAFHKRYFPDDVVFLAGQMRPRCGIVLSGCLELFKYTPGGDISIMERVDTGDIFGLPFILRNLSRSPVSCRACAETEVLFFDPRAITHLGGLPYAGQQTLLNNLVRILAERMMTLQRKTDYLSCRSIRERLFVYLEDCTFPGSRTGEIPFTRTALAHYLCVDRCALSRELSRMQREGLLMLKGRSFRLLFQAEA